MGSAQSLGASSKILSSTVQVRLTSEGPSKRSGPQDLCAIHLQICRCLTCVSYQTRFSAVRYLISWRSIPCTRPRVGRSGNFSQCAAWKQHILDNREPSSERLKSLGSHEFL